MVLSILTHFCFNTGDLIWSIKRKANSVFCLFQITESYIKEMSDSSCSETRRTLQFRIHVLPKITHQYATQKERVKGLAVWWKSDSQFPFWTDKEDVHNVRILFTSITYIGHAKRLHFQTTSAYTYTEPAVRTGKATSNGRQYDNQETFHFISRTRCEVKMTQMN